MSSFTSFDEKSSFIILDFSYETDGKDVFNILFGEKNKCNSLMRNIDHIKYFNLSTNHLQYSSFNSNQVQVFRPIRNQENIFRPIRHQENVERMMIFNYLESRPESKNLFCVVLDEYFTLECLMSVFDLLDRYLVDGVKLMVVSKSNESHTKVESRSYLNKNYLFIQYGRSGLNPSPFLNIVSNLHCYKDAKDKAEKSDHYKVGSL